MNAERSSRFQKENKETPPNPILISPVTLKKLTEFFETERKRSATLGHLKGVAAGETDKWHDETFKLTEMEMILRRTLEMTLAMGLTAVDLEKGEKVKVYSPPSDNEIISLGHRVRITYSSGEEDELVLGSSLDLLFLGIPLGGQLTTDKSPIGKALIGRRKGDSVIVETPGGSEKITIISVSVAQELFNLV